MTFIQNCKKSFFHVQRQTVSEFSFTDSRTESSEQHPLIWSPACKCPRSPSQYHPLISCSRLLTGRLPTLLTVAASVSIWKSCSTPQSNRLPPFISSFVSGQAPKEGPGCAHLPHPFVAFEILWSAPKGQLVKHNEFSSRPRGIEPRRATIYIDKRVYLCKHLYIYTFVFWQSVCFDLSCM